MHGSLDIERLRDLLAHLHEITKLQLSLHDRQGREIYSILSRSAFCNLICESEEGYRRCVQCDMQAIAQCVPPLQPMEYRCHTGLIDITIPVTDHGQAIAYVLFGQILDDTPIEEQWAITRRRCQWHGQPSLLKEAFWALPRMTRKQIRACYEIINACVSEVRLEGVLKASKETDAQRLHNYIHTNYSQPLSLQGIEDALSISKTRLYQLAEQLAPGQTITGMITQRRVSVAKRLLQKPDALVRDVAERVGIPDYNYFTKVFRRETGMTPSQYRAKHGAVEGPYRGGQ